MSYSDCTSTNGMTEAESITDVKYKALVKNITKIELILKEVMIKYEY